MKTVVIWDELSADIRFFIHDNDLTHLNGKYVNDTNCPKLQGEQICDLVYDEYGNYKVNLLPNFPADEVRAGAKVVVMGFLP